MAQIRKTLGFIKLLDVTHEQDEMGSANFFNCSFFEEQLTVYTMFNIQIAMMRKI
ncbi:MAG: hypothetical protein ACTS73_05585 [Arsenophonus sp. NEOnobi-MAG3]